MNIRVRLLSYGYLLWASVSCIPTRNQWNSEKQVTTTKMQDIKHLSLYYSVMDSIDSLLEDVS